MRPGTWLLWPQRVGQPARLAPSVVGGWRRREWASRQLCQSAFFLFAQERRRSKRYDRVAIQVDASSPWQWKSTVLSSFETLFQCLRPTGRAEDRPTCLTHHRRNHYEKTFLLLCLA